MSDIESKVQVIDSRSPTRSIGTSVTRPEQPMDEDMVMPSISKLQTLSHIQEQVDAQIKELQTAAEKGKCKSQRGGSQTVFVIKSVGGGVHYNNLR